MADDGVRGTGSTERPDEGRGTIQMRQRLRAAGLALAILVLGLGSIVAVTEYEVRAGAGPRLLTASDVIAALVEQGGPSRMMTSSRITLFLESPERRLCSGRPRSTCIFLRPLPRVLRASRSSSDT